MGSYMMLMSIFLYLLDVIVNDAAHTQLLLPERATSSSAVKKVDPQPPSLPQPPFQKNTHKTNHTQVSKLVFYAQSTGTVISGQKKQQQKWTGTIRNKCFKHYLNT